MTFTHWRANYYAVYVLLFALVLADRLLHLFLFSFVYADSDQTVLWMGATEMLRGNFHEPAFYGQSYNTLFESFLAVPLLAIGLPVYKALPIISTLLGMAPFIILSLAAHKKQHKAVALVFLATPLLLPSEYIFITQLPRGFVAGVCMATVAVSIVLFADAITPKKLVFSALWAGISLVLNPNGILLLMPVYLWLLLSQPKKIKAALVLLAGALPGIAWQLYTGYFYSRHPEYLVHGYTETSFSLLAFWRALTNFHELFYGLFPFVFFGGMAILALLVYITSVLHKKGQEAIAMGFALTLTFMFCILFIGKLTDGTASIFFPYSRMFLALPVLAGIGIYFIYKNRDIIIPPKKLWAFAAVIVVAATVKFIHIPERVEWNVRNNSGMVTVFKNKDLVATYHRVQAMADEAGQNTLVFAEKKDELNYGITALSNGTIKTVSLACDRKTWVLKELDQHPPSEFLLWCENEKITKLKGLNAKRFLPALPVYTAHTKHHNHLQFFKAIGLFKRKY